MTAILYLLAFLAGAASAFVVMLIIRARKRISDANSSVEKVFLDVLRY